jgi:hypothetical protein
MFGIFKIFTFLFFHHLPSPPLANLVGAYTQAPFATSVKTLLCFVVKASTKGLKSSTEFFT